MTHVPGMTSAIDRSLSHELKLSLHSVSCLSLLFVPLLPAKHLYYIPYIPYFTTIAARKRREGLIKPFLNFYRKIGAESRPQDVWEIDVSSDETNRPVTYRDIIKATH